MNANAQNINGIDIALIASFLTTYAEFANLSFLAEGQRDYFYREEVLNSETAEADIEAADEATDWGCGIEGPCHSSTHRLGSLIEWANHLIMTGRHPEDYEEECRRPRRFRSSLRTVHTPEYVLTLAVLSLRRAMRDTVENIEQAIREEQEEYED